MRQLKFKSALFVLCLLIGSMAAMAQCQPGPVCVGPAPAYVFQWDNGFGPTDIGIYFNSSTSQYQFKNVSGQNIFTINSNGNIRLGNDNPPTANFAQFGPEGDLNFFGNGDYLVDNNRYAFRAKTDEDIGIFFNAANNQIEYRDGNASSVFSVKINSNATDIGGDFSFNGTGVVGGDLNVGGVITGDGSGLINVPGGADNDWTINGQDIYRLNRYTGIGTSSPSSPLHIDESDTAFVTMRVETDDANKFAIIWAKYNYQGPNDVSALYADTRSTDDGWGYGIQTFSRWYGGKFRAEGSYTGTTYGIRSRASGGAGAGMRIGVYGEADGGSSNYGVYCEGDGWIDGAWMTSSDKHLKKDVEHFDGALSIIDQLKVRKFEYRQDGRFAEMSMPTGERYGFLAQEVEGFLPELVAEADFTFNADDADRKNDLTETYKGIDYVGFIPILTQGIKEQQEIIDEQAEKIDALSAELETLKSRLDKMETGHSNVDLTGDSEAWVGQNIPNPFDGSSIVNYYLPEDQLSAWISLFDNNGREVKTYNLESGNGNIIINARELATGIYVYTLVINGRVVDSKKLSIER